MLPALLLIFLLPLCHALPSTHTSQSRQQRLAAFNAQKPLHTSALLAGAAATPVSKRGKWRDMRVRDLRTVTGEDGLWVNLDDLGELEREGQDVEGDDFEGEGKGDGERGWEKEMYGKKIRQHVIAIQRREGWDEDAGEI
ncbi:hypothetical protein N7G274_003913 [Stereocaulon virgatum]|uniref:Uncharacterized protein n=1 Tax=Stereocaulon virgatum TaxID=373712 RepID=A0ABR4AFI9_9LECA